MRWLLFILILQSCAWGYNLGVDDTTGADANSTTIENVVYCGRVTPDSNCVIDTVAFLMLSLGTLRNGMFIVISEDDSTVLDSTAEFAIDTVDTALPYQWIKAAVEENVTLQNGKNYQICAWGDDSTNSCDIFRLTSGGTNTLWYGTLTYDGTFGSSYTPQFIFTSRKIWAYLVVHTPTAPNVKRILWIGGD